MVAITVVLAGVLYLWVSSLADTEGDVEMIDVKAELVDADDGAPADVLTFEVSSGRLIWADYYIKIDGATTVITPVDALGAGVTESNAGDAALWEFTLDTLTSGTTYNVKIVNIENNAVVYDNDLICKAG